MSAIRHEIILKKPYKLVYQILDSHYNNSSEVEGEYKFVTPELEILLVSTNPKENVVIVSFPNKEYTVGTSDLKITQLDVDRKKLAYFVQKEICKIYIYITNNLYPNII